MPSVTINRKDFDDAIPNEEWMKFDLVGEGTIADRLHVECESVSTRSDKREKIANDRMVIDAVTEAAITAQEAMDFRATLKKIRDWVLQGWAP